jgi:hypothetical protein
VALVGLEAVCTVQVKDVDFACKDGFARLFDKAVKGCKEEQQVVVRLANCGFKRAVRKLDQLYSVAEIVALEICLPLCGI